jgi:hypothetical protein
MSKVFKRSEREIYCVFFVCGVNMNSSWVDGFAYDLVLV